MPVNSTLRHTVRLGLDFWSCAGCVCVGKARRADACLCVCCLRRLVAACGAGGAASFWRLRCWRQQLLCAAAAAGSGGRAAETAGPGIRAGGIIRRRLQAVDLHAAAARSRSVLISLLSSTSFSNY